MNSMTIMLQATEGGGGLLGGGMTSTLIMFGLIFVVMYFFMMRPQQKRQKEIQKFRDSMQKGQKVITAGGIYGTVKEVKDTYIIMEVDNSVSIRVDKTMVMKDPTDLPGQAK